MSSTKKGTVWATVIGLGAVSIGFAIVSPTLSWWKPLALYALLNFVIANVALIFLITRHVQLVNRRRQHPVQWARSRVGGWTRQSPEDYYLLVLGSGGHTKEMLMMMDDGFCDFDSFHRRYLVSSGDKMSMNHLEDYEAGLKQLCEKDGRDSGTYDVRLVTRARRVHQPLSTTPFTAAASLFDIIFTVILSPPANDVGKKVRYPRMIFSNGPATGFFVGLAVHMLKMLYIIPEDRCCFVYIESWARISTLSLTGKIFHYTGIADGFAVQHEQIASQYGITNVGPLVFNSRRQKAPESAVDKKR